LLIQKIGNHYNGDSGNRADDGGNNKDDSSSDGRDGSRIIDAVEGTAVIEAVAAVTETATVVMTMAGKAVADSNDGEGDSRWHIRGDAGS
jgi:hypothetical protein